MNTLPAIARIAELPFSEGVGDPRLPSGRNPSGAWLLPLRHAQIPLLSEACLTVVHGHALVFRVGLHAALDRALTGEAVVYLDGANTFDPFLIGRVVRTHRQDPRIILSKIHVARAFTCRQMERLVSDCLGDVLLGYQARIAVLSGIFEPFYDASVSRQERARLVGRMLQSFRALVKHGYSILCLSPSPVGQDRMRLRYIDQLRGQADRSIRMTELQGVVKFDEEGTGGGQWEIARTVLDFK